MGTAVSPPTPSPEEGGTYYMIIDSLGRRSGRPKKIVAT